MKTVTYEAIVENGQIRLPMEARLPEHTRVFVVVPGVQTSPELHIRSPRLAHREDAAHFILEVIEEPQDA